MSIHKTMLPDKGVCKVTFTLTDTLVDCPKEAALLGDFNNWESGTGKMQKSAKGYFEKTIELPLGRDYQFRYFVNNSKWENDWQADAYGSIPFSDEENMVIKCDFLRH